MKKMFTKRLIIYMAAAFAATIIFIFATQTMIGHNNHTDSAEEKLEMVKEKLLSNEGEIEKLVNSLGENNLAKTRAFAEILANDETLFTDAKRLQEICDKLMVNELHVIDAKGIITHSTISEYIGFDMNSGEQSAAFMVIIEDPSIEIVQEPQKNVIEGTVIQYIGVARKDAKGFVQVGIRPEVLEETLASTEIDVVLKEMRYGESGYVFAVDLESGLILAHLNEDLIGKKAEEAGIYMEAGEGKTKIDGISGYYVTEEYDGMLIGTFLSADEYYRERTNETIVVSLSMLVIFVVLLVMINRTVDRKIVKGIHHLAGAMRKIADGNLDIVVKEESTPEFAQLSGDINTMVESIRNSMDDNQKLLVQQKADMEKTLSIMHKIKHVCGELGTVSQQTLSGAEDIFYGTEQQKQSVSDLEQVMETLAGELNHSADASVEVTKITEEMVTTILDTEKQMDSLQNAMEHIDHMSREIEKIIVEIEDIAGQTNLLALNASIEAARAGETGRGFAVVAMEVGNLAARSSQAAKETNELISNSMKAISAGLTLTKDTAVTFGSVVEEIERANSGVKQMEVMVRKNAAVVGQAVAEIDRITHVVNTNAEISENSKQISANMADITERLLHIVAP